MQPRGQIKDKVIDRCWRSPSEGGEVLSRNRWRQGRQAGHEPLECRPVAELVERRVKLLPEHLIETLPAWAERLKNRIEASIRCFDRIVLYTRVASRQVVELRDPCRWHRRPIP